jgi:RNA polymerase sigma factor (sigma-70 family)
MTIAPFEPADAELAVAAAGGNQLAFSAIYDRYADRLYDFCVGMLRDGDAAADCAQDVFVTAATKLVQLHDPNRLRAWLYAIARHEALARIRDRRREMPREELPELFVNACYYDDDLRPDRVIGV